MRWGLMPRALLFLESGHGVRRVCKRQQVCVGVDLAVDVVNQHCGWKGRFGRLDRCCRRFVDAVGVSDFDETELVANKTAASVACEVCGQWAALVECVTCRVLGCVTSAAVTHPRLPRGLLLSFGFLPPWSPRRDSTSQLSCLRLPKRPGRGFSVHCT